jgi:HK97 family phage major capsid protein
VGPVGLVSAVIAGGTVQATATNVFAASDVYTNAAALPARWRSNASWMANGAVVNSERQLPVGTNVQQSLVDSSTTPPKLLDWPIHENSNMDGVLNAAAADYVLLSGDFKQYVITIGCRPASN